MIQHQYPLHRISYCADDKSDKRMFTFIAKDTDKNEHHCFVFDSEKCVSKAFVAVVGNMWRSLFPYCYVFLHISGRGDNPDDRSSV